eukprot:CAMPEP_0195109502 /NCGR_PEP_ID=MMETSP0448-20130528/89629_1 /TAXON_ID=66468 /ORGANISM="Heterocapsa triquestra, Strain CCMP 448" /LENGTH=43 /DNA_ID= /DNA_START= /DNA_END= /DNA_ORIENTATION=
MPSASFAAKFEGALERLADLGVEVCWAHVRAHRGHFLNEIPRR